MARQLADAVVEINNESIGIVPNSLSFDEGLGEQKVLPVSEGGGRVSQVFSNDLESNFATISFQLRTTVQNIERARAWKVNANNNVVSIAAEDGEGNDVIRTFTQAVITNNAEIQIQAEGTIEITIMSNAPV